MQIKVYALPGGKLQVMVDGQGVDFAKAEAATRLVLAKLKAAGLDAQIDGLVESHRTAADHVHVVQTEHHHH